MKTFNNESFILECFKDLKSQDIILVGNKLECRKLHHLLKKPINKNNWIDLSKKTDLPPDFYNEKHKIMMDIMRIDDHAYLDSKGHIHNETLKHEGDIYNRYFKDYKRDDLNLFIIPDTKLPTLEDHNFERYLFNFKRVFNNHIKKIPSYQSNHKGYKLIFFIMDESSAYYQSVRKIDVNQAVVGQEVQGFPHYFWLDKCFVDEIMNSNVDYVVWYAPYKLLRFKQNGKMDILPIPKCAIIDVKNIRKSELREYDYGFMTSIEL